MKTSHSIIIIIVALIIGLLSGFSASSYVEKIKQDNLLKLYTTTSYWTNPPGSIELACQYGVWKDDLLRGDVGKVAYELESRSNGYGKMAIGLYDTCPWLDGEMKWREKLLKIVNSNTPINYAFKIDARGILAK